MRRRVRGAAEMSGPAIYIYMLASSHFSSVLGTVKSSKMCFFRVETRKSNVVPQKTAEQERGNRKVGGGGVLHDVHDGIICAAENSLSHEWISGKKGHHRGFRISWAFSVCFFTCQ